MRRLLCLSLLLSMGSPRAMGADEPAAEVEEEEEDAPPALGQGRLSLRVLERGTGYPVQARVYLGDEVLTTDALGRLTVDLPAGEIHLELASEEHKRLAVDEVLSPQESVALVYRLERHSWVEEVVVYGEPEREEVARTVYSAEELSAVPGAFGDPIRALQSLPGVARPNSVEGDIVVRGAEGINTATFIDGIQVPYLFHAFIGRSVINPSMIDEIEFYPGGMPSRFGSSLQAVVNARMRSDQPKPGVHGKASVDLLDGSLALDAAVGRTRIRAAARYAWVGGLIDLASRIANVSSGGSWREGFYVAPHYFDYNLRIDTDIGPGRFDVMALGAADALVLHEYSEESSDLPDPADILPYDPSRLIDAGFHRFKAGYKVDKGWWTHNTWVVGGWDYQQNLIEGLGVLTRSIDFGRVDRWSIHARHDDRIEVAPEWVLRMGEELRVEPIEVQSFRDIVSLTDPVPITKEVTYRGAFYGDGQFRRGPTFLSLGLRGTVHRFNEQLHVEPEPRISLRQKLHDRWTTTAFLGRFTQRPPADRYANALGNPELTVMSAWQASWGLEGRWPNGLQLDVTLYGSRFGNIVVTDTKVETEVRVDPGGYEADRAYSVLVPDFRAVPGWAFGMEAMLRWRPSGRFFGWIAFTASKSLRVEEGRTYPGDYDQPLALTLVGAYTAPKDWRISGRFRLTSGQPYTPVQGIFVPGDAVVAWDWAPLPGDINSARFPVFAQLDLRVQKTWTAKRARWTLYLDILNLTNARNPLFATYDPTYSELVTQLWIPIIPSLGLEVAF